MKSLYTIIGLLGLFAALGVYLRSDLITQGNIDRARQNYSADKDYCNRLPALRQSSCLEEAKDSLGKSLASASNFLMLCIGLIALPSAAFLLYGLFMKSAQIPAGGQTPVPQTNYTPPPPSAPAAHYSRSPSRPNAPAQGGFSDPYAELDRLKQMFNKNLITEAEYNRQADAVRSLLPPSKFASSAPVATARPAPTVSSPASSAATTLETELAKLIDLKAKGLIDEEEYKTLRQNLINRS